VKLSVVVPAYCTERRHGSSRLLLALVSLCRQTLPTDEYEIIVVDNGSEPPVRDLVRQWGMAERVRVIRLDTTGLGRAYNAGIEVARGSLVLVGTDDEVLGPKTIEAHVRHHAEAAGPVVGFGICRALFHAQLFRDVTTAEPVPGALEQLASQPEHAPILAQFAELDLLSRPVTMSDVEHDFEGLMKISMSTPVFDDIEQVVGAGRCHRLSAGWLAMRVGNHTVPTDALTAIGGFDETLDQHGGWYLDADVGLRLIEHGLAFSLATDAPSTNIHHPRGAGSLLSSVSALAYFFAKHRRMDIALSSLYFQRSLKIAHYSRLLAAARPWWPDDLLPPRPAGTQPVPAN
jgi:GT2 family glycosyltransferase